MNTLSSVGTIVAAILAIMTTVVSSGLCQESLGWRGEAE